MQDGRTPLMCASSTGRIDCVQVLLDRGAQATLQDEVSAELQVTNKMLDVFKKVRIEYHTHTHTSTLPTDTGMMCLVPKS